MRIFQEANEKYYPPDDDRHSGENLKMKTESLLLVVQYSFIRTNYIKAKIDKK